MTSTALDPQRREDTLSIASMCREVLRRIEDGFDAAGVPLPERRFTSTGTPTQDCEQLAVVFRQAYYGPPGDEASLPQRCDGPRSAVLEVHLVRCIPTPKGSRPAAPKASEIQESAESRMQDAWLLLDLAPDTDTWNGMAPGGLGVIGTVESGEPSGGYQSTVLTLTMAIP